VFKDDGACAQFSSPPDMEALYPMGQVTEIISVAVTVIVGPVAGTPLTVTWIRMRPAVAEPVWPWTDGTINKVTTIISVNLFIFILLSVVLGDSCYTQQNVINMPFNNTGVSQAQM
jgi:hypothetical protein